MSGWIVTLDPPSVIPGRSELNINGGAILVDHAGVDWGEAALQQYMAEQRWGSSPAGYRVPNRQVTIPLALISQGGETDDQARVKLQQKVGLIQREGGVLKRQRAGGEVLYCDVVDAKVTIPDVIGDGGAVEPNAVLHLECLPDFYGEEIELDAIEDVGQIDAVLKQGGVNANVKGDYPARARVVLTEQSSRDQKGCVWGLRSVNYDAASTAALQYDCYRLTPLNGATSGAEAGAYSGNAVTLATPAANIWYPLLDTDISGVQMTHVGSYRVWARVKAGVAGQKLRFAWTIDNASEDVYSAAVELTGTEYVVVNLGEVKIDAPPVGSHWWRGYFQLNSTTTAGITLDKMWLQPLDDAAGQLRATAVSSANAIETYARTATGIESGAGTAWTRLQGIFWLASLGDDATAKNLVFDSTIGLAVPSVATVRGIKVKLREYTASGTVTSAKLIKAGTPVGTSKSLSQAESYGAAGGPSDLWGETWTPAQIHASNFGFQVEVTAGVNGGGTRFLSAYVEVIVYYTLGGEAPAADAVLYSARQSQVRFDGNYREDTASTAYVPVTQQLGDAFRLPPSGLEGRPCELLVKQSRGLLDPAVADAKGDKIRAQVFYRPCHLGRV